MAKKPSTQQTVLPFEIEGYTASRENWRNWSTNLDHYRKVNFDRIAIRPDAHNARRKPEWMTEDIWEQHIHIPDLADKIYANNGPVHPILGDFHIDGKFYITDGERRYRAIRHLLTTERLVFPNGKPVSEVLILLNPPGTTDQQRKRRMYAGNDGLALTTMQKAHFFASLTKAPDNMTQEQIAEDYKVSRQTIGNFILAATELPQDVQDAIDRGEVKLTNALADLRKGKAEAKGKSKSAGPDMNWDEDDEPIITGALADKLEKEEKDKGKLRGDEDEFEQEDNSITFAGSKSGPAEDKSSGAIVLGKDAIYMKGQREACIKQFLNRFDRLFENACKLMLPEKPGDEQDEERAAILHEKRMKHVISQLAEEYDVTVR